MLNKNESIIWTRWVEQGDEEVEEEVALPTKYEVCGRCEGKGTHVNPNIDGHGISQEEWDGPNWDQEEQEAYMSGRYDVSCYECHGTRVVKVVDWDYLEQSDPKLSAAYIAHLDDDAEYERTCAMERAMGA